MRFTASRNDLSAAAAFAAQGQSFRTGYAGILLQAAEGMVAFTGSDGYTTYTAACEAMYDEPLETVLPGIFPQVAAALPGETVSFVIDSDDIATITSGRSKYVLQVLKAADYPVTPQGIPVTGGADGDGFRLALKRCLPAVARDNPVPALTGILLRHAGENLELLATDKYCMAYATCPWTPVDESAADVILPGDAAARLLRTGGDLFLGWDENRVQVSGPSWSVTCRTIQGVFPKRKAPEVEEWIELDPEFIHAVKRAAVTGILAVSIVFGDEVTVESSSQQGQFAESLPLGYNGNAKFTVSPKMLLDGLSGCVQPDIGFTGPGRPLFISDDGFTWAMQPRRSE